jgi:hypothetical protein
VRRGTPWNPQTVPRVGEGAESACSSPLVLHLIRRLSRYLRAGWGGVNFLVDLIRCHFCTKIKKKFAGIIKPEIIIKNYFINLGSFGNGIVVFILDSEMGTRFRLICAVHLCASSPPSTMALVQTSRRCKKPV